MVEELRKIVVESLQSEEGNLNKAVDLAINFSTKNSISSDQLLELSTYCGSEEAYELAYIFAKTAASLSTGPEKAAAHYNAGTASYFLNLPIEAEEQYKLALESDPKHVNTHSNYGLLLSDTDRLDEAEEQYKLSVESDPNDASTHSNYGNLLKQMDRFDKAEEQYKIALKLDSNKPSSHGAYSLFLLSKNLENEAINEMKMVSNLFRENGDKVKEHLSLALLYEEFVNKYYKLKDYKKSGEYAEISGDKYIEAGKQAGESFKNTSLTKGYTLKGRAKIRKLEIKTPFYKDIIKRIWNKESYDIKKFTKIIDCIMDASKCYEKAAKASPKDNQLCDACSFSMFCLSDMLDYMLAVIKQEKTPELEDKLKNWNEKLSIAKSAYKEHSKGELFIEYQLYCQGLIPDEKLALAGNCGGDFYYVGTAEALSNPQGYETSGFCRAKPEFEELFRKAVGELIP